VLNQAPCHDDIRRSEECIASCILDRNERWDSSIGIAMGYDVDGWDLIPSRGTRFFYPPQHPDWLWGKQPVHETDHSPPSSAKDKNGAAISPLPHTCPWRGA
jgi:hypothetical protein